MKPLVAADALHQSVLRVSAEMRPAECRSHEHATVYAVFSEASATGAAGAFLGLATPDDVAAAPHRIFADLIPPNPPQPLTLDTPIEDVLAKMEGASTVAVLDAAGQFAGAITPASLFAALFERERALRHESERLHRQAEADRAQLRAWSGRLEELHAASTHLLGLLAMRSLEDTLLQRAIDALTALLQARYGAIGFLDEQGQLARFFYTGLGAAEAQRIGELPKGLGLLGAVLRENRPLRIDAIAQDPRAVGFPPHHPPMRTLLAVPISYQGEVYGRVYLCDKTTGQPFSEHDELLAKSFGESLALVVASARAQTERQRAEESLRASEHRLRAIVSNSADGIITIDDRGIIESFNPAAERMFGYPASDVIGRNVSALMPEPDRSHHDGYLQRYIQTRHGRIIGMGPREVVGRRKDGSTFSMDLAVSEMHVDGLRFIGIVRDISERKQAEERLKYFAHFDPLTTLPNRLLFQDRLAQSVINAARHNRVVGVMFLDLDRFKTINDTLGHHVGDAILKAVAERLNRCVREGDTIARLGGDEYAIVLADMAHAEDAASVARRILQEFSQPFQAERHELYTTVSIGITLYPTDDDRVEQLLKNADTAMYRAKEIGRNTYQFYTADMNDKAVERLDLETHLRRAQRCGEFSLYYQPQVELSTGRIVGVEALIRWLHPDRGMIPPAKFIPVAEETGLIVSIGEWVLRTAVAQAKAWRDAGLPATRVSVNVSPRQFHQPEFPATVARLLHEAGLPSHCLEVEVTESLLVEHQPTVVARFAELRELGVHFSIDDFGTGYSSLSYLKRFPIHTLKIDRSFVTNITADTDDAAIASAIVSLAHNLRLRVVAEGVETEAQASFLCTVGCDTGQGYLYSRPLPASDMEALLRRGRIG